MQKVLSHLEEYIGRYVMAAAPILIALGTFLTATAAALGGVNTSAGRAVSAAAGAVGSAAAIAVWLRNLGVWQVTTTPALPDDEPLDPSPGVHPIAPFV